MLFELLRENAQRPENTVPGQNSRLVTAFQATYQHTLEQQQRALQQIRRNIQLSHAALNTNQPRNQERDARNQLENMEEVERSAPRTATVLEAVSRNLSAVDHEIRAFFQPLRNNADGPILPTGVVNHPIHRTEQDQTNYRNEVDDEMSVIRTNQQYQEDLTQTQEIAQMIRDQTNLEIPAIDFESSIGQLAYICGRSGHGGQGTYQRLVVRKARQLDFGLCKLVKVAAPAENNDIKAYGERIPG